MRGDEFLRELSQEIPGFDELTPEIDAPFDLARNVYLLRVRADLTQEELAVKAGIRQPRIAEIERGDANPRLETLAKLASALGVSVGDLFANQDTGSMARIIARVSILQGRMSFEDVWQDTVASIRVSSANERYSLSA